MLIYLAEILFANPAKSTDLAAVFNSTFTLFRDNLGTFGYILESDAEKYDYIFSNPPYVTSGSGIIKEEIRETPRTADRYPISGLGLESLALEWIVQNLRGGGRALVVVPDGILGRTGGKKLRDYMLRECYLDAIVSLPNRTFFANEEHTYILVITKKHSPQDVQSEPVFTYLVSNIGEQLTSVKRTRIDDNDLPEMETLFRTFAANRRRASLNGTIERARRCKIVSIDAFIGSHWVIDRWWTRAEKIEMGAVEDIEVPELDHVLRRMARFEDLLRSHNSMVGGMAAAPDRTLQIDLGDESLFSLSIGKRVLRKDLLAEGVPTYSTNVFEPMGFLPDSNGNSYESASILWGIDGNFDFNLIPAGVSFCTTDHCGTIHIRDPGLVPEYVLYALFCQREEESFDRSFRPSLANMRRFSIEVPIDDEGVFDVTEQSRIARQFMEARDTHREVKRMKLELDKFVERYVSRVGYGE